MHMQSLWYIACTFLSFQGRLTEILRLVGLWPYVLASPMKITVARVGLSPSACCGEVRLCCSITGQERYVLEEAAATAFFCMCAECQGQLCQSMAVCNSSFGTW